MKKTLYRGALLIAANVVMLCMLSFYRTTDAAPPTARQPFANPVVQREQMVRELQEIKALLKEQNALLRKQNKNQLNETSSER